MIMHHFLTVTQVAQYAVDNDGHMPVLYEQGKAVGEITLIRFLDVPEVEILAGGRTIKRNADDEIEVMYPL
jgi:hypothetical protein